MSANVLPQEVSSPIFPPTISESNKSFSSDNWNIYRTRFLVRARQLTEPFSFTDPLGREHHGVAGDYLVQSSEGLMRIAPKEIFEDVYVALRSTVENPPAYPFPAPLSS